MDADTVRALASAEGERALAEAAREPDPGTPAAAQRLRAGFRPELAAAALGQVTLRRRAVTKFGPAAADLWFTRDGLEQATRPEVAAHHAGRFRAAGVRLVVDLGCGIGSDALAFAAAGLEVLAVDSDSVTAEVARLNLAGHGEVLLGDAEALAAGELAELLADPGVGVFCDPARRTSAGRLWRVADFTPGWSFVTALLTSGGVAGVKLGPALPHHLVVPGTEAEWVSARGDTVEVGLWAGRGSVVDGRVALVLPDARLVVAPRPSTDGPPELAVSPPRRYVYEPDGAVIRAGGVAAVGALVGGALLDPQIAYLTSDELVPTPYASAFEVLEVLPYQEKQLRRWLHGHEIGRCEIKKRGIDVDPATLRRQLSLRGPGSCTLILSRTPRGGVALVTRRVS